MLTFGMILHSSKVNYHIINREPMRFSRKGAPPNPFPGSRQGTRDPATNTKQCHCERSAATFLGGLYCKTGMHP